MGCSKGAPGAFDGSQPLAPFQGAGLSQGHGFQASAGRGGGAQLTGGREPESPANENQVQ